MTAARHGKAGPSCWPMVCPARSAVACVPPPGAPTAVHSPIWEAPAREKRPERLPPQPHPEVSASKAEGFTASRSELFQGAARLGGNVPIPMRRTSVVLSLGSPIAGGQGSRERAAPPAPCRRPPPWPPGQRDEQADGTAAAHLGQRKGPNATDM
jgi:hypothetical protein